MAVFAQANPVLLFLEHKLTLYRAFWVAILKVWNFSIWRLKVPDKLLRRIRSCTSSNMHILAFKACTKAYYNQHTNKE